MGIIMGNKGNYVNVRSDGSIKVTEGHLVWLHGDDAPVLGATERALGYEINDSHNKIEKYWNGTAWVSIV